MNRECCDGCAALEYEKPFNRYDLFTAHCCDPDKPVLGKRRVVAVSQIDDPRWIVRPVWCRGFQSAAEK